MMFQKSGFEVITRDENRSIEETFSLVEGKLHKDYRHPKLQIKVRIKSGKELTFLREMIEFM